MTQSLHSRKFFFVDNKWDSWLNGQSQTSPHLTNKVCDKETNEQMHGRNTGSGQDLNLERPYEKPIS